MAPFSQELEPPQNPGRFKELRHGPLSRNTLAYTAITRAKTALNAYCTGKTNPALEQAFAEPKHMELDDLFPSKK